MRTKNCTENCILYTLRLHPKKNNLLHTTYNKIHKLVGGWRQRYENITINEVTFVPSGLRTSIRYRQKKRNMIIFKKVKDLSGYLSEAKATGKSIGFVPTMGALHQGHLSLLEAGLKQQQLMVCSIFVNPTQFNDPEDLRKYPRPVEQDIALLIEAACPVLFLPEVEEIYPPDGQAEAVHYDLGYLETVLEGSSRQGHFQGVAQVVHRLLQIIQPETLYLGQKDFQQCMVIQRLVAMENLAVKVETLPTLRAPDGLALSSRNARLSEGQRAAAGVIYQCLISIQAKKAQQPFSVIQKECIELLEKKGFKVDYLLLADAQTLELLADFEAHRPMVALIAAFLGEVRLIDNLIL